MLNYRNTSLLFLLITLVFIIAGLYSNTYGIILYCILASLYLLLLVLGAIKIQMNFYLKAINKGKSTEAKVSLTFDDGPDKKTSIQLLEILEKHNIKASFFCVGNKLESNKTIIKEIDSKGHLIGNHSWSHSILFDFFLPRKMLREILKTDNAIKEITGKTVRIFRPPYGVSNPFLSKALKKTGHIVIGWSLRSFDTVKAKHQVIKKVESGLKQGDIILLHDANPDTILILDELIMMIKSRGIEIVRLDDLIDIPIK